MGIKRKRLSWGHQLVRIHQKGIDAFRAGTPSSGNPYSGGQVGGTGIASPGGNVQNQRRRYWHAGWQLAKSESEVSES